MQRYHVRYICYTLYITYGFDTTPPLRAKRSETYYSLQRYSKSAAYQNKLLKIQINIVST